MLPYLFLPGPRTSAREGESWPPVQVRQDAREASPGCVTGLGATVITREIKLVGKALLPEGTGGEGL